MAIALRLDVTNVYEAREIDHAWDTANIATLELASDTKVAAVVLNLLNLDENSRLQEQCIQNIQLVVAKCKSLAFPNGGAVSNDGKAWCQPCFSW